MNEFFISLMTGLAGYLGGNPFLIAGMVMFFLFGFVYVLGLPRFLTIPLSLIVVFIVFDMTPWLGFLGALGIGLGIGFLIYLFIRG
jgi:hypothetical protein